ncbi:MAG: tRNA (adenosine(37)-N6)-threonylcarbamoyltransferase complex ATPase subunit type 1 TsaE [Acidobacteria bacterium]|nr:tRNA (adenosine(37)-N6)-threonylcarbamoyltransferase complex ATPase subunit type 1 TsaE [Acidobacteriota bacterium]
MSRWRTRSEDETMAVGYEVAARLRPDGVLLLSGDLGAGKTVLVRGVADALGIDPAEIQSPTFTLMRSYQGRSESLLHVDLYRLESEEVSALGLEEALHGPGVKVVEWAERLPFAVAGAVELILRRGHEGEREIEERANQEEV